MASLNQSGGGRKAGASGRSKAKIVGSGKSPSSGKNKLAPKPTPKPAPAKRVTRLVAASRARAQGNETQRENYNAVRDQVKKNGMGSLGSGAVGDATVGKISKQAVAKAAKYKPKRGDIYDPGYVAAKTRANQRRGGKGK